MAFNKTSADLEADVRKWLNRDDQETIANIPSFIEMAKEEYYRTVKTTLSTATTLLPFFPTLNSTGALVNRFSHKVPEDFISAIDFKLYITLDEENIHLQQRDFSYFNEYDHTYKGDTPYYVNIGEDIEIYPTKERIEEGDFIANGILTYFTNKGDYHLKEGYDLMLYWSLKHASIFLRDAEQEQYWSSKAMDAVTTLDNLYERRFESPMQIFNS